jgi:hypothetical protein
LKFHYGVCPVVEFQTPYGADQKFKKFLFEISLRGMKKILKPKFILGIPFAIISLEIFFGIIFGYFIGKFFSGEKTGQRGKLKSAIFNIGNWKIHFHHWLFCSLILISGLLYKFIPFPQFSVGFLGGLIFQGISCYPDWYKIITKKKENF